MNLSLYLAKSNNLAGLGSQATSRNNLGLGNAAVCNVGNLANELVQLDGSGRYPAYDGSQIQNIDVVPVGTTILVNDIVAPSFLKENGALVSRAAFPRLWAYANASSNITTEAVWLAGNTGAFSNGDLATTFRLPDARGEFFRMYDDGRGVDSGRSIQTHQADSLKDHTHPYNSFSGATVGGGGAFGAVSNVTGFNTGSASIGAAETRPRNNAKLACIKY